MSEQQYPTDQQISHWERIHSDTTTSPWTWSFGKQGQESLYLWGGDGICVGIVWHYRRPQENASFIITAHDSWPRLLAAARDRNRLAAEVARLREALGDVHESLEYELRKFGVRPGSLVPQIEADVRAALGEGPP